MVEVNSENYYEDTGHMSVSKFKALFKCEVGGLVDFNDIPKSIPLLVGSYVDSYIEGTLDKFKDENPEIYSSRGATKGELKADYKQAEGICRYIDNDVMIQNFLSGEKQTIMTGIINGVPFKIKMDSYIPNLLIADLKVMATVTDKVGNFYDFVTRWNYHWQLACYQEIVYQNTGLKLPCYIVAVTKETPTNSVIIKIPQKILDMALYEIEGNIERLYDVYMGKVEPNGCGVCPTCIKNRKSTPIINLESLLEGM